MNTTTSTKPAKTKKTPKPAQLIELYGVREIASNLGISVQKLRALWRSGKLPEATPAIHDEVYKEDLYTNRQYNAISAAYAKRDEVAA